MDHQRPKCLFFLMQFDCELFAQVTLERHLWGFGLASGHSIFSRKLLELPRKSGHLKHITQATRTMVLCQNTAGLRVLVPLVLYYDYKI